MNVYTVEAGSSLNTLVLFAVFSSLEKAIAETQLPIYEGLSIQLSEYPVDGRGFDLLAFRCSEGDEPRFHDIGAEPCTGKWHVDNAVIKTLSLSDLESITEPVGRR